MTFKDLALALICILQFGGCAWAQLLIQVSPTANSQATLADLDKDSNTQVTLTQALAILKSPALRDSTGKRKESVIVRLAAGTYRLDGTPIKFFDLMMETNRVLANRGKEQVGHSSWRVP